MAAAWLTLTGLLAIGCAYGGGGRGYDAGSVDSGVILRIDSGIPPGVDAGRRDSGGFPPVDSGGPRDSGGGACSESPCRLAPPQCGCPSGQGCYLGAGGAHVCGTPGPENDGQTCAGETSCRAGSLCIGAGGQNFCARLCGTDSDCSGAGNLCLLELGDGSGGALPGFKLCTGACNPASGVGCPSTMGCALYSETAAPMRTFTSCRPAGTASTGFSCTDTEDCAGGHFCADAGFGNECIRICTYPSGFECTGGGICNAFTPDPVILGGVQYGYCL
jgi:hypothetical protein